MPSKSRSSGAKPARGDVARRDRDQLSPSLVRFLTGTGALSNSTQTARGDRASRFLHAIKELAGRPDLARPLQIHRRHNE
jgi:hypothetical protein